MMPCDRDQTGITLCAGTVRAVLWMATALAGLSCSVASAQSSAPLHTNNPRFRIPFQFQADELARIGAVEVQLHVSTDGGNWSVVEAVPPSAQRFTFEAPRNGEYRFAVRTVDRQGRAFPEGAFQPSLTVVVDDRPPQLSLSVFEAGPGQFSVQWQATDDYLDASSLRIEYLDSSSGVWQPVSVSAAADGIARWSDPGAEEVLVRGTVSDLAGNSADASAAGKTSRRTSTAPTNDYLRDQPDLREPVADARPAPPPSELTSARPALPVILPNMPHAPVPALPVSEARWSGSAPGGATVAPGVLSPGAPQTKSDPLEVTPPPVAVNEPAATSPPTRIGSAASPAPSNERRVNSRTFRIGYELRDVGPSGVGSVELYITEDNGARWFHYGADPDRQSPFDVVVPRDGRYGFAIRVRNGIGLVSDPPQPTERPEIVVVVDQAGPSARLNPLQQQVTSGGPQVIITWTVQDDCLAERPVALYYSASPTGPWEQITGWIANQGRYVWMVTPSAPQSVYVRLEARDAAGNLSETVTDQPLLIDPSRPTARILEVESIGAPTTLR